VYASNDEVDNFVLTFKIDAVAKVLNEDVIDDALLNNSTSVVKVWSNAPLRNSNSLPTDNFCVIEFSTTGIILPVVMVSSVGNCDILGIS
jgi:hypothetical protein